MGAITDKQAEAALELLCQLRPSSICENLAIAFHVPTQGGSPLKLAVQQARAHRAAIDKFLEEVSTPAAEEASVG